MHYIIMRPPAAVDVRKPTFDSYEEMHRAWNVVQVCETEEAAVSQVRLMFPDAVGFPAPVHVGSGQDVVLALLERTKTFTLGDVIPFVAIVQAVPENDMDRKSVKKRRHFHGKLWRAPVIKPANGIAMGAELRGNELEVPIRPTVIVGRERGKLVVYVEFGGTSNSIIFDDPRLDVYTSEPPATLPADGDRDVAATEPTGAA